MPTPTTNSLRPMRSPCRARKWTGDFGAARDAFQPREEGCATSGNSLIRMPAARRASKGGLAVAERVSGNWHGVPDLSWWRLGGAAAINERTAMFAVRVLRGAAGVAAVGVLGLIVTGKSARLASLATAVRWEADVVSLSAASIMRALVVSL